MTRLLVAAEDELGNQVVRDVTDRCLCEVPWIEAELRQVVHDRVGYRPG
jgi:hypothetical protein